MKDGPQQPPASTFATTEFVVGESDDDAQDTPEALMPEGGTPDVLTDLVFEQQAIEGNHHVAAKPTLAHVGRYALKEKLAVGGLGTVYEAWDPLLARTVALKTLHFDLATPARVSLDGLFLNEARTAAGLDHRGIVTVHDAGLSAHGVYIAMERLRGRDLRDALAQGWRPSPTRAALLVRRVAEALAYAHAQGVVHCDIKPANLFVTDKLRPKVLDFGIARAAGAAAPMLEGWVAGSPHYLAPEQLAGGEVDARTDVYALGVVLHELLCGHKAFAGDTLEAISAAVLQGQATPAHEQDCGVPVALSLIAAQAMARDANDRFASAQAMATALRGWASTQSGLGAATSPKPSAAHPRRAAVVWLVAAASCLTAMLGLAWWSGQPHVPHTGAAPLSSASVNTATPTATLVAAKVLAPNASPEPPPGPVHASEPAPKPAATRDTLAHRAQRASPTPAATPVTIPTEAPTMAAPAAQGAVRLAITPWGQVEVNGSAVGTTPPLNMIMLPIGEHHVVVRNNDAPPYTTTVQVEADKPAVVRHRFAP